MTNQYHLAIYQLDTRNIGWDMELSSIRRNRLRDLINSRFGGVKAQFAAFMDWPASDIGRYFNATKHGRSITERKAREIEKRCRLPAYWMDSPSTSELTAQSPLPIYNVDQKTQDKLLTLFDGLTDAQQEDIIEQMEGYRKANLAVLKQLGGKVVTLPRKRAAEKLPPAPRDHVPHK